MKRNNKSINVLFLGMFIALVVIAIAGMNMRTLINNNGVTRIAKKAGANDAVAKDVLENYTFTSDTAGINQEGTIKDYSEYEGRFKLLATAAPESKIYNLTLSPGYYTHINVDATDVYNEGHDEGYDEGFATAQHNHQFEHISDEKYYIKNGQTYNLPSNCNCVICGLRYYDDSGEPRNYFRRDTSWTYSSYTNGYQHGYSGGSGGTYVVITYNVTIDWPNNTITCSINNSDAQLYIMPIY